MPAKKRATRKHTPRGPSMSDSKKVAFFAAWLRTGSSIKAGKECNIRPTTGRSWKELYRKLWEQSVKAHEAALQDLRQSIAHLSAVGLHAGAERASAILASGQEVDARDLAALIRALSDIDGSQDRIWRLNRELPTETIEVRTGAEAAAELGRKLRELGIDTGGTVLDGLPEPPA